MMQALRSDFSTILSLTEGLKDTGFQLLPLGQGNQGKGPSCPYKNKSISFRMVTKLMSVKDTLMYGVRLENMVVVDVDERDPKIMGLVEKRFGKATVQVDTPRGRHFYYERGSGPLPDLRKEGLPIDLKTGVNSYVVGPGSVRPDGGVYTPIIGCLARTSLSTIKLSEPKQISTSPRTGKALEGTRNDFLCKKAREYVPCVDTLDELIENLLWHRDNLCEAGHHSLSDIEVTKIAKWAWKLRLTSGGLYQGRNSSFKIQRVVMDTLLAQQFGVEAYALYCLLNSTHGHIPGKRFALSHTGLRRSGRLAIGRDRFNGARKTLLELGLLIKTGSYKVGSHPQQYQLGTLRLDLDRFSN